MIRTGEAQKTFRENSTVQGMRRSGIDIKIAVEPGKERDIQQAMIAELTLGIVLGIVEERRRRSGIVRRRNTTLSRDDIESWKAVAIRYDATISDDIYSDI